MVVEEAIGRHSRINVQSEKPSPAKGTGPSGVLNQGSSSVRSSPRSASPSRLSSVVKQNTEDSTANEEEPSPDVAAPRLREVDLQQVSEKHQREQGTGDDEGESADEKHELADDDGRGANGKWVG